MKNKIIKIIILIITLIAGGIIGAIITGNYIINNTSVTLIERTDYGEFIHYELLGQEFGYFMEYNEKGE